MNDMIMWAITIARSGVHLKFQTRNVLCKLLVILHILKNLLGFVVAIERVVIISAKRSKNILCVITWNRKVEFRLIFMLVVCITCK